MAARELIEAAALGFDQKRQPDAQEVVQDAMMRAHRALTKQYDEARCAALAG